MKRIIFSTTALSFAMIAPVFAAGLLSPNSVAELSPQPRWGGFYAGLNAGYAFDSGSGITTTGIPGFGSIDFNEISDGPLILPGAASALSMNSVASMNNGGFIAGGQFGYNHQIGANVVVGVEVDFQGTTQQSHGGALGGAIAIYDVPFPPPEETGFGTGMAFSKSLSWLGTVRGRLGYLVTPMFLLYGTGGFAYGGANANASINQVAYNVFSTEYNGVGSGFSSYSGILTGWTAGAGVEWMFMPNWSLKLEGLYYNLGSANWSTFVLNTGSAPFSDPAYDHTYTFAVARHSTNFSGTIARVGVGYHFNAFAAAPVLAQD